MDTAKGVKEVNDFFGVMEVTSFPSTLRHDKLVNAQKEKRLKELEIPQLSGTRWACHYFAVNVNLYKSRYDCLVEALEEVIENSSDRTEATGILAQVLSCFSYFIR